MTELKLIKPIEAHDEKVEVLKFRELTGADIAKCGFPYRFEGLRREINTDAIVAYISRLCDIPASSVGAMSPLDWTRGMGVVLGFFADTTTPTES